MRHHPFTVLIVLLAFLGNGRTADPVLAEQLIGYTEMQTNLPGGRHANVRTMRAVLGNANGSERRPLATDLANKADTWTQFAGWSPEGKTAVIGRGWQSPESAQWEEEHKQFRFTKEGCLYDSYLVEIASGKVENVSAVERVSFYNSGLFFWPNDPTKLGFTALIDGNSHPFRMDRDGCLSQYPVDRRLFQLPFPGKDLCSSSFIGANTASGGFFFQLPRSPGHEGHALVQHVSAGFCSSTGGRNVDPRRMVAVASSGRSNDCFRAWKFLSVTES